MRLPTNGLVDLSFRCRWMTYKLSFHKKALKEFADLDPHVRERIKRKLAERLEAPRVPADRLSGQSDRYKIKLKSPGLRLVYEVDDDQIIVFVVAIDKRERSTVYEKAAMRLYRPK